MKMNKWTMALAAAGVVSLSSVAQAQEAVAGANALAASTTLSGYVSTSWKSFDPTDGSTFLGTDYDNAIALDRFALDVVDLKFASAQGAGEYATGYTVELWAGPQAGLLGTGAGSDTVELYQANLDVRLPVGNGLDLKIGQFTTVVGAETYNYNENAFYMRSFGFLLEPTHHTGILASYQLSDDLSVSLGFANDTDSAATNAREGSGTAYLLKVGYTLPESTGFLGGTTLTYARIDGADTDAADTDEQDNHYIGASVPLGVEGLSYSLAWDIVEYADGGDSNVVGHYLSYAANDKATIIFRYEHGNTGSDSVFGEIDDGKVWSIGLDYQLWENVISRVEYHDYSGDNSAGADLASLDGIIINLVYTF